MKFLLGSFAVVLLCGFANCDINSARNEALKVIDQNKTVIFRLANETFEGLKWKPGRTSSIFSQIRRQAINFKDHNIAEIEDETKVAYLRAEIQNCKNAVFGCIARSANDGEVKIISEVQNYLFKIQSSYESTLKVQVSEVQKWTQDYTTFEQTYKNRYNAVTQEIYQARDEAKLKQIVAQFGNLTNQFQTLILKINITLESLQVNFLTSLQNISAAFRTALINAKNTVFADIKKCFDIKSCFF